MKALEPYNPWFYEEVVQALNIELMAELAKKTHIPLATGERIFTKWGFKDILEKRAAMILQPDVCYAGGITELKIIAGMAEAYYTPLAPHNPQGPCSLAASLQIAAAIPNFLIQERGDNEYTDLLAKPLPPIVNGHRPLLTEPGLGITIDENKLMAQVGEPRPYHAAVRRRRRLGGRLVGRVVATPRPQPAISSPTSRPSFPAASAPAAVAGASGSWGRRCRTRCRHCPGPRSIR